MKDKKIEDRKDIRDQSSVKGTFDFVYDLIMANAWFIMFNIHMLVFLVLFRPGNLLAYYVFMGVLCLNLTPSYAALMYALDPEKREGRSVMKTFLEGYGQHFLQGFLLGLLGIIIMVAVQFNGVFFLIQDMDIPYALFQAVFFLVLVFVLSAVPVMMREKKKLKEVLKETLSLYFRLLPVTALTLFIMGVSLFFSQYIVFPVIFAFGLAAMTQNALTKKVLNKNMPQHKNK